MNFFKILNQFFLYSIGGGSAFLINFFLTYTFTEKLKIYYLISAILGYTLSLIFNFIFQTFITFKIKEKYIKNFLKFSTIQLTGLLIYSFIVYILTDILKIYYLISITLSSLITFCFNFIFLKNIVFKK